ncbi:MAG: PA2169 family four-helix-bundle protein [Phycisphaerales bacterium]|nr:PA2169 family four-helix-bundle protein [Phycisphaerales bacterium]
MKTPTNTTTTMPPLRDETIEALQDLISINIDSCEGLRTASDTIDDASIAGTLRTLAAEREGFARDLQAHVRGNHTKPEEDGSVRGTLHRWWLSLRGTLQGGDAHAVLAEAERGEDAIKACYEKVLKDIPGSPLQKVLMTQYSRVKAGHDKVRDLRDSTK